MKKIDFTCSSYTLKFKQPFETSKGMLSERKGFLIKFKSDSAKTGTGDACPLPEFGSESYIDAENELRTLKLNINLNPGNYIKSIEESLCSLDKFPALHHGFEQALLSLLTKEYNISLNEILNETSKRKINVNAVIGLLPPEESVKEAEQLIKQGYNTLKIKAGRDRFEDDLKCINAVRKAAGDKIKLRIDVNGKWNLNEAANNLKKLEPEKLEYAEQPVNSLDDFVELKKKSRIPIAADESIRTVKDASEFIKSKAVNFLVLKPMMLGGVITTLKIKNAAELNGIGVIISTSFESVVGRALAVFAASTVKAETAHGLSTAKYFEKDLFKDPYAVNNGIISLE
jgi:o-succinylbenzoate synthase